MKIKGGKIIYFSFLYTKKLKNSLLLLIVTQKVPSILSPKAQILLITY